MQNVAEQVTKTAEDQREAESGKECGSTMHLSDKSMPNNLLMFKAALSKVFQDIAECVSEEEFLKTMTVLQSEPSVVKKLHKAMKDDLTNGLEGLIQEIVEDECVIEGARKLTKLKEETTFPANVKLWRPPGDVILHLRSLDAEKMKKECKKLESYISDVNKENQEMMKIITKRRENIQAVNSRMKKLINMPFKLSEMESDVSFGQECIEKLYDNDPIHSNN